MYSLVNVVSRECEKVHLQFFVGPQAHAKSVGVFDIFKRASSGSGQYSFVLESGSGILTIVHEDSPEKFRVIDNVITQPGARTMALDTKNHNILLVTAKHGHGATHFNVLPNSFVVLVVGK